MPFKDLPQGTTQYLDEDGKLVENPSPEELEKFRATYVDPSFEISKKQRFFTIREFKEMFPNPLIID